MRKLIGALLTLATLSPAVAAAQEVQRDVGVRADDEAGRRPDRGFRQRDDGPRGEGQREGGQRGEGQRGDGPRPDWGNRPRPDDAPRPDPAVQGRPDAGFAGRPDRPQGNWQQPDRSRPDPARQDPARPDTGDRADRTPRPDRGQFAGRPDRNRTDWRDDRRGNDWTRSRLDRRDDRWTQSRFEDRTAWNRGWRGDSRYAWNDYRTANRGAYHLPRYYAPGGRGGYRRLGVGVSLGATFQSRNYWIADPWSYRLPDAYEPYRWVRYYDDALLVDLRSGQVVDAVYGIFW